MIAAHWLDRAWDYQPAASHADSDAFRQRQRERINAAQQGKSWDRTSTTFQKPTTAKLRTVSLKK